MDSFTEVFCALILYELNGIKIKAISIGKRIVDFIFLHVAAKGSQKGSFLRQLSYYNSLFRKAIFMPLLETKAVSA